VIVQKKKKKNKKQSRNISSAPAPEGYGMGPTRGGVSARKRGRDAGEKIKVPFYKDPGKHRGRSSPLEEVLKEQNGAKPTKNSSLWRKAKKTKKKKKKKKRKKCHVWGKASPCFLVTGENQKKRGRKNHPEQTGNRERKGRAPGKRTKIKHAPDSCLSERRTNKSGGEKWLEE